MKTDRAVSREDREVTETVKALIEIYKSAFGERWESVYTATVSIAISPS